MGFGPLLNIGKIFVGAFNGFKGAAKLIEGVTGALEKLGPTGQKAAGKLKGIAGTITSAFGAAGIAAAVGLAFAEMYQAGAKPRSNRQYERKSQ